MFHYHFTMKETFIEKKLLLQEIFVAHTL
jgi:hypothetical protein